MKKTSTLVVSIVVLTCFLVINSANAQVLEIPGSIQSEVKISAISSTSFTLKNSGDKDLNYTIDADSLLSEVNGVRLVSDGLEQSTPGIVQLQNGWSEVIYVFYITENLQWTVEDTNPFAGTQHLRCTSNGSPYSGGVELHAPEPEGNATIIDMMANLDLGGGTSWEFIARDENYDYKKLMVAPDGSLSVLSEPDYNVHSIPGSLPSGYFNLRFAIDNTTSDFTISVNGVVIFTQISDAPRFNQFSISLGAEVGGSILDVDDFKFMDGSQNVRLLAVEPANGTIPPFSSQTINVQYDTRNVDAGSHSEILEIFSNDVAQPTAFIPVTTMVKQNEMPVLNGISNQTVVSGETVTFNISTTDPDDSLVAITWSNFLGSGNAYLEEIASGNGFLTFSISAFESEIDYELEVTLSAKDARGGITTKLLTLNVLASLWNNFSLTNFKTGATLATFTDTVTVDIAHPDIDRLTIQSNFTKNYGDRVKFILDGVEINSDKSWPYYLSPWSLEKLSGGYHTLTATAYVDYIIDFPEKEFPIAVGRTIVHVINSASITSYQVVNKDGVKVMDLVNGSVIDLSRTGPNINIIAQESIGSVRSVKFELNNVTARIDNGAPYSLGGNPISGDTFWKVKAGTYTLSAIPYLKYFGWGPKGNSLTINFQVVNGTIPATTIARIATSTDEVQQIEEVIDQENILSVYPIPVADELHIELHESVKGNVVVNIMSAQGKSMYISTNNANEFRKHSISTEQLGISSGIYFVMVTQTNGKRVVKKFIKE
ncbi:MAG: T9SS type A sorting domain-containing protein [Chryseolinea sp.]